jgi:hypothetical protein
MWNNTRSALAGLLLTVILGACGSGHEDAQNGRANHAAKRALSPADALARGLVGGLTQVKPGNAPLPLEVKFALRARPSVSQPLDVDIRILPTAGNLDRVYGKVEGEEGLELVGSGELAEAARPVENIPIDRSIQVLPKQDGIYNLTATISVDMAGQVSTQTYTFPVIAGVGIPDLPTKPAAPAGTAKTTANAATASTSR